MEFEWDLRKSKINWQKHGIDFEQATAIWSDTHVEVANIARTTGEETRNATMGWIGKKIYIAIWTKRRDAIRLISVRRASHHEEKIFYEKIQNAPRHG